MRAMRDREMIEAQMRYNEWASRRWQLPDPPA